MRSTVLLSLALAASAYSQSTSPYGQAASFPWIQQLGGSQAQTVAGIATDPAGNLYVAGNTTSLDMPTQAAFQPQPGGSGLYRVDGTGPQWQNLYRSGLTWVTGLTVDPENPNIVYAIDKTQGLFRCTDAGATCSPFGKFTALVTSVAVDPASSNTVYVATLTAGIFKTTDGGATWAAVNNGVPPGPDGTLNIYVIRVDPNEPSVLLAGTYPALIRSGDGGASWQSVNSPGASGFAFGWGDIEFDPKTPGLVYVVNYTNLLKSADHGATWTELPLPPGEGVGNVNSILIDPKHAGTLYLGGLNGGLWESTDGGNTWTNLRTGGNASPLAADPASGALYVFMGGGLLMSTDGFATTTEVGPRSEQVTALAAAAGHLFVGAQVSADVFVTKYDPQGNVIYATYFGGSGTDLATAIAVDANGAAYVTGTTSSLNFPVSAGAYATHGGNFVSKLNADGSLAYSTFFSDSETVPYAIAVDSGGHAYIAGTTEGGLPTTAGAYQTTLQGTEPGFSIGPPLPLVTNAFLAELDPAGASLVFATYIGNQSAAAVALALAPNGSAIVAGGGTLYRMSGDGSSLLSTTTLQAVFWALATDSAGNIYAGGGAGGGYPFTPGAFQNFSAPNDGEGVVTRFDPQFNVLASTALGDESLVKALAFAANGDIIAGGSSDSHGFPLRGASQEAFNSATGFLAELTPDLSSLVVSTYAGDTRMFNVWAVAPAIDGGFYFGGSTDGRPFYEPDFLVPVFYGAFPDDGFQAFVVKLALTPANPRVDTAVNAASQLGAALSPGETIQVLGDGFGSDAVLQINGNPLPLLSQSQTKLTAALPADFGTQGAATVAVQSGGMTSNPLLVPMAAESPGIFTVSGSGAGQGYILNQDGTLNSSTNPAKVGAPITVFATGVGAMTFTNGYAVTDSPVNVFIDGFFCDGIAAILAPVSGLPGDVYQIGVYVPNPAALAAGNPNLNGFVMPPTVPITMQVNGVSSQPGVTISVSQ